MAKVDQLIREIERGLPLTRADWDALKLKYASKKPSPIPATRKKARVRKTVVRLKGAELAELRRQVYGRDKGLCVDCHEPLYLESPYEAEFRFNIMELSHVRSRGAGGGDTLDNCVTRCRECHKKSHDYGPSGKKPVPRKSAV